MAAIACATLSNSIRTERWPTPADLKPRKSVAARERRPPIVYFRVSLTATGTALRYKAGGPRGPIRAVGLLRDPSGEHELATLLSPELKATPEMILDWFVSCWRVESTFQRVRAHLGVETGRHWLDRAIPRTTPALLGLFSLITLCADDPARSTAAALCPNTAAWYRKDEPNFSDSVATVRRVY